MNKKFLGLFLLTLFLFSFTFAAAPTLSAITATPVYATDHNYGNWKPTANITLSTLVTGADLNKDGCGYAINGTFTYPTAVDLNLDTNILAYTVMTTTTDDINWGLSCTNTSGETGFVFRTIYLDANAPLSGSSFDEVKTLTLTTSDYATNTGNGSGIKNFYYRINGGTWTDAGAVTQTDLVFSAGDYTVDFYAIDNLDNNEWTTEGDYWTTTFYAGNFDRGSCALTGLFTLILVAGTLLALVFGGLIVATAEGSIVDKLKNAMGAIAVTLALILIVYIIAVLLGAIC